MSEPKTEEIGPYSFVSGPRHMVGQGVTADSLLLVDFLLPLKDSDRVCDLGTGAALIPMLLAWKSGAAKIVGVEAEAATADAARRNVEENSLSDRILIVNENWLDLAGKLDEGSFDLVVCNPPYVKRGKGRVSPSAARDSARREGTGGMEGLIAAAAYLLGAGGRLCLVYPAGRLGEVKERVSAAGLYPARLCMVYSLKKGGAEKSVASEGSEAKLFLLEAVVGEAGEGLGVEEPVFMD